MATIDPERLKGMKCRKNQLVARVILRSSLGRAPGEVTESFAWGTNDKSPDILALQE